MIRERLLSFGLPTYQVDALCLMDGKKPFAGARVLEIGGHDLPAEVKFEVLGARSWFCVDLVDHGTFRFIDKSEDGKIQYKVAVDGGYQTYDPLHTADEIGTVALDAVRPDILGKRSGFLVGNAADIPEWFAEQFDAVISIAAFEHLSMFALIIKKLHDALDKNGNLQAYFGPIWSSYCGHHAWISEDLNFNDLGPIGWWDHLLLSQPELYEKLRDADVEAEIASFVVDAIYCSPTINKLFFEDYEKYMELSPFPGFSLESYGNRRIPPEIAGRLAAMYPRYRRFDAYGIVLNAWKTP
ncbi:MAG TPA: methyltransferase domain-containing protein [Stellaceae bacterium]|nr:methyltransferase domain-containing protein [Stellaceae bacterium]